MVIIIIFMIITFFYKNLVKNLKIIFFLDIYFALLSGE